MTLEELEAAIGAALTPGTTHEGGVGPKAAMAHRVAAAVNARINTVVQEKPATLKVALVSPGAFTGTGGGPAPVVVVPGTINSYNPRQ